MMVRSGSCGFLVVVLRFVLLSLMFITVHAISPARADRYALVSDRPQLSEVTKRKGNDRDGVPMTIIGNPFVGIDIEDTGCVWMRGDQREPYRLGSDPVAPDPACPNPFNPTTRIAFSLPTDAFVDPSIYDVTDRRVDQIVFERVPEGTHTVEWEATAFSCRIIFDRTDAKRSVETRNPILP